MMEYLPWWPVVPSPSLDVIRPTIGCEPCASNVFTGQPAVPGRFQSPLSVTAFAGPASDWQTSMPGVPPPEFVQMNAAVPLLAAGLPISDTFPATHASGRPVSDPPHPCQ